MSILGIDLDLLIRAEWRDRRDLANSLLRAARSAATSESTLIRLFMSDAGRARGCSEHLR